jgi:hypothetical protein
LFDVEQTSNGVVSTINLPNGTIETITSDWVIACDGANSTIREKCQIAFPGEDIPEQFMVADAKMSSSLPTDEIHVFFNKGTIFPEKATIFSAFPLGSEDYRLVANLYNETPRQTFHAHEVKEVVAERTYGNFVIEDVSWISPFWIHGKIIDNMQHKAIFLLGDAAHIHSPAGGQGMNNGLQDAYNLAWKLAMVIKQKAKPAILASFQSERYSVDRNVVTKSNSLTNMMLFDKKLFHKVQEFGKTISKKEASKKMAEEMMQLSLCYSHSPIIDYDKKTPKHAPKQGERALDVKLVEKNKNFYSYFSQKHTVLIFSGKKTTNTNELLSFIKKLNERFLDIVKVILISNEKIEIENAILDTNYVIHDKYHITDPAIYIIRPDTYIGYFSDNFNIENIEQFFNHYLTYDMES